MRYHDIAVTAYDAILTLPNEVRYIWTQKARFPAIAFVVLKYATLLGQAMELVTSFTLYSRDEDCLRDFYVQNVWHFVRDVIFTLVMLLRCFAIWDRNIAIGLTLGAMWLALAATDGIRYFGTMRALQDPLRGGCTPTSGSPLVGITSPAMFDYIISAFDTAVLVLTVARTARLAAEAKKVKIHKPISFYVFRDGILYFVSIDVLVLFVAATVAIELKVGRAVNPWQLQISLNLAERYQQLAASLAVQRLVLNLRQVFDEQTNPDAITQHLGKLDFAHGSVLGNIGAPLSMGGVEDESTDTADILDEEDANGVTTVSLEG